MYVIIVGGGQTGRALAKNLIAEDEDVVVVEKDEKRAEELADELDALIIKGDGTEAKIMDDAGIEKAYAVIALTKDDNVNLMICQQAKKAEVPKIAARVNNPDNRALFMQAGVEAAISTTTAIATEFLNAIRIEGAKTVVTLVDGKMELLEVYLTETSPAIGKPVGKCGLPTDSRIISIERKDSVMIAKGEEILEKGDLVWVVAASGETHTALHALVKE